MRGGDVASVVQCSVRPSSLGRKKKLCNTVAHSLAGKDLAFFSEAWWIVIKQYNLEGYSFSLVSIFFVCGVCVDLRLLVFCFFFAL
jgi:hypothetical protein